MRGLRVNIGIVWLLVTIVLLGIAMILYSSYVTTHFTHDIKGSDVFAVTAITICLSYFMTSIIDDVGFKIAPKYEGRFKVVKLKRRFRTFAGRGSTTSYVTYSVSLCDEETSNIKVLYSSADFGEALKIGQQINCTIKGNMLINVDL